MQFNEHVADAAAAADAVEPSCATVTVIGDTASSSNNEMKTLVMMMYVVVV
jgi:hypothetical protein